MGGWIPGAGGARQRARRQDEEHEYQIAGEAKPDDTAGDGISVDLGEHVAEEVGRVRGPKATSLTAIRLDVSKTVTNSALRTISSGDVLTGDCTALVYGRATDSPSPLAGEGRGGGQGVTVKAVREPVTLPSPLVNWMT